MRSIIVPLLASLALLLSLVAAQTCNSTASCPQSAPCCSEYGFCGTGTYCLGGCEPLFSYRPTSCLPNPICQSASYSFTDLSRVQQNASAFDGNATQYDWVVNSGKLVSTDDGVRLVLTETNGGTKISSTRYVHYGKIDFVLETSKWAGVVTAAITMSDVKDEIDWEFTGNMTDAGQTNFWYLGIANYSATQTQSVSVDSDTSANFHTYSFDWQEDSLQWLVDGKVVRTVQRSDTVASDGTAHYPSTPSRVQISIWPAGISSSGQGTIDWAGGMIDWTNTDYTTNGYFWNTLKSVTVACADDPDQHSDTTGWSYTESAEGVADVHDTNSSTVLGAAVRSVQTPHGFVGGLFGVVVALVGGLLAVL